MVKNLAWVLLAIAAALPAGALAQRAPRNEDAVAYQINPAHSGSIAFQNGFAPPLKKLWSIPLPGYVSYPLIARNRVVVSVFSPEKVYNVVFGLNRNTGAIKWRKRVHEKFDFSNAAYDDGRVFVVSDGGLAQALTVSNGDLLWQTELKGQFMFISAPTAFDGRLFTAGTGGGGTFYALDAKTGALLWKNSVENGDRSSPAIGGDSVFVSYPCQVYRFEQKTGRLDWHFNSGCEGGGGLTAVYSEDRIYARGVANPNAVLDAQTGQMLAGLDAHLAPALFDDALGHHRAAALTTDETFKMRLYSFDPATGATLWTFTGDGELTSAPIAVNGNVIVGSWTGNLYMLDGLTGAVLWSTNVGHHILPPNENYTSSLTGLAAGDGMLIVPADHQLLAFAPASSKR